MLERDVERKLVRALKARGIKNVKFSGISTRGMPDRLIFLPKGKAVFIELKRPGEERNLSENQRTNIAVLRMLGFPVLVSSDVNECLEFINEQAMDSPTVST